MAKTSPLVRMLSGALGDLITERMTPKGALDELMNMKRPPENENRDIPEFKIENPAPPIPVSNRKRLIYKNAVDDIMKRENNPFQAFDEEEGFDFANRKMGEALKQALDMEDYATAKKYMFENQVRFEDLGFADTEADQFIDSVLEEVYYGEE
jgi:hypothetical protein|tara:strand:+ start:57 stop:515 length:459 start_codon:yes stop_codon:yes gene_type:complete